MMTYHVRNAVRHRCPQLLEKGLSETAAVEISTQYQNRAPQR